MRDEGLIIPTSQDLKQQKFVIEVEPDETVSIIPRFCHRVSI